MPHGTEQRKLNVPAASAGMATVAVSPAAIVTLMPSSGTAKPCVPAIPVSRISRTSPFFAVTAEGENAQLSADISIVRFAEGDEEVSAPPSDDELVSEASEELLELVSDALEVSDDDSDALVALLSEELTELPEESEELVSLSESEVEEDDVSGITDAAEVDDKEEAEPSVSTPAGISHAARTRTRERNAMERIFFIGIKRGKVRILKWECILTLMMRTHNFPVFFLRIGLCYVFIAFGTDKFIHPFLWLGWIPLWMEGFLGMPREAWLPIIGAVESLIGIAALLPVRIIRIPGFIGMIGYLIAVLTQTGLLNDTGIRDTGLLLGAIALLLAEWEESSSRASSTAQ